MKIPTHRLLPLAIAVFFLGGSYVGMRADALSYLLESLSLTSSLPQETKEASTQPKANTKNKIELIHSDLLTFDKAYKPEVQRLIGQVSFRHGNATMTCDSAYLNEGEQSFEAFGKVHMIQGDTLNIYAEYLFYDGIKRLAKLRRNVRLENGKATLFTDSLDYDRVADMAFYFNGGVIEDEQNTLSSDYAQYFPQTEDAEFYDNVKLRNDKMELTTEQLFYNTKTRISRFEGPTDIVADSGSIYSTLGIYDMANDVGILLNRSEVRSRSNLMIGDSIYYDGTQKLCEVFGQMELSDTAQKVMLFGDYGFFDEKRYYGFATSRAYAKDYSQKDTLYLGADTIELLSFVKLDSLGIPLPPEPQEKSNGKDSLDREIRAYRNVRVFRSDAQAIADSLSYISRDSLLVLYQKPIIWQENRQTLGDTISIQFANKKVDYVDILENTLSGEKIADLKDAFNQLKGKKIRTYVQDSTVRQVIVDGDVESISYLKEEKSNEYNGLNRLTSQRMVVDLEAGKLKRIHWQGSAHGKVYPMNMAQTAEVNRLPSFVWHEDKRPQKWEDVISKQEETNPESYTLTGLKRFSGAKAELKAYAQFDNKLEEKQKELAQKQAVQDSIRRSMPPQSYPYIFKPSRADLADSLKPLIDLTWLYNHFSDREVPDASRTSPFIGILEQKNLRNEENASDKNSSKAER